MGAIIHLLDPPVMPAPKPEPEKACVERAYRGDGDQWTWEAVEERDISDIADWNALLIEIGQKHDKTVPWRARWVDATGHVRRSAHYPVWVRPS